MNSAESQQGHLIGLPTLLTTEEAAAALRVRASWLERQAAKRKIPFTMLGGCYRFTADHLTQIVVIFEAIPNQLDEEKPYRTPRPRVRQPPLPTTSNVAPLVARPRRQAKPQDTAA